MKDDYSKFKGFVIDEEEFRRMWGKEYDRLIDYRNHLKETGHPGKARHIETRLELLDSIFLHLEEMRFYLDEGRGKWQL